MADRTRNGIILWGLGILHTVLAVFTFGVVSSPGEFGRFLTEVATYPGAALTGALWMTSWCCTRRALRRINRTSHPEPLPLARTLGCGALWGGVNGVLFLVAWLVSVALPDGAVGELGRTIVLLVYLVFPFPLVFGIGARVGSLCATLALPILLLSRRVTHADLRPAKL